MRGEPFQIGTHRDGRPHMVSRWVPNPDEWDIVLQAWKMRAAKNRYKAINARLHIFKTVNSYTTMFQNRLYLGEMRLGENIIKEYAPAMIDQATWDAVQAINKSMKNMAYLKDTKLQPRRASSSYTLTGLIHCGQCGAPMNGHVVIDKRTGIEWKYYRCSLANRTGKCKSKLIALTTIEYSVLSTICEYIYTPEALQALKEIGQAAFSDGTTQLREEKKRLVELLAGVRHRITNLTDAVADSGHSRSLLNKIDSAEVEEANLISQISEIDRDLSNQPSYPSEEQTTKLIRDSFAIIDSGDPQAINRLLHGFINKIIALQTDKTIKVEIQYFHPPKQVDDPPPEGPGFPKAKPLR